MRPAQVGLREHDDVAGLGRARRARRVRAARPPGTPAGRPRGALRGRGRCPAPRPVRRPSRSPAMSSRVSGRPPRSIRTSITSRVVPATSEVSAASRPASAFSSVDLPTFGGPTSATSKPSRTRSAMPAAAQLALASPPATSRRSPAHRREHAGRQLLVGEVDRRLDEGQRPDQPAAASPPPAATARPPSARSACRRCAAVSAASRSPSPSTCARSSRPFSSARRVNSPGSAGRRPGDRRRAPPAPPRHDRRAAVQLQLGHVLAGEARRARESRSPAPGRARSPVAGSRSQRSAAARGGGSAPGQRRGRREAPAARRCGPPRPRPDPAPSPGQRSYRSVSASYGK